VREEKEQMKTLGISPITGTVYYGNAVKDKDGEHWTSKTEIPTNTFIQVMMSFIRQHADESGVMTITANGKPRATIKLTGIDEEQK
jgi:hypothetical protein